MHPCTSCTRERLPTWNIGLYVRTKLTPKVQGSRFQYWDYETLGNRFRPLGYGSDHDPSSEAGSGGAGADGVAVLPALDLPEGFGVSGLHRVFGLRTFFEGRLRFSVEVLAGFII